MGEGWGRAIDIPDKWVDSAQQIAKNRWLKILVIGATDSGKSTYCTFLSRWLLEEGHRAAIVDADIGQKDIGPPATITLGYPDLTVGPTEVEPAAFYFVGAVSPAAHFLPMIIGARILADLASGSFVLINTTGLLRGPGRVLKSYKIEALNPSVIVVIGKSPDMISLLKSYRNHHVLRVPVSAKSMSKTQDDRRSARERSFRSYFSKSVHAELDLKSTIFQRSLIFTGKALEDPGFLYSEKTPEGLLAVSEYLPDEQKDEYRVLRKGFEQNLLCGVADRRGRCFGAGIIKEIDFINRKISLLTPVSEQKIRVIQFGELYISPEGCEIGRRRPGSF